MYHHNNLHWSSPLIGLSNHQQALDCTILLLLISVILSVLWWVSLQHLHHYSLQIILNIFRSRTWHFDVIILLWHFKSPLTCKYSVSLFYISVWDSYSDWLSTGAGISNEQLWRLEGAGRDIFRVLINEECQSIMAAPKYDINQLSENVQAWKQVTLMVISQIWLFPTKKKR